MEMSEFSIAKDIDTELRQIIAEASAKKTIPHVKDRAERAVSSISKVTDQTTLDRSVEEVLSTLLIATEVGSLPRLILISLNILQKLASSNVITSETFLHMITVLCKATSSVSGVSGNQSGSPNQSELESAHLKCLQTLHLLQVETLAPYFLNEIALSQVISMCTSLINSSNSSPVIVQAASAAISQLEIFLTETTFKLCREDGGNSVGGSETAGSTSEVYNAMGELKGVLSLGDHLGDTKSLFVFIHDLVTMSAPELTSQVFCRMFGSTRLRPQQAVEILCDFFDPAAAASWWCKRFEFVCLITNYLIPIISKSIENMTDPVKLRLFLRLFVRLSRHSELFPQIKLSLNKIFVQLNNFILDESMDPVKRVLFTECITGSVASNSWVVFSSLDSGLVASSPMGGDSPVRRSTTGATITESIIDSVCLFVHRAGVSESLIANLPKLGIRSINEGTGSNAFSLLYSNNVDSFSTTNLTTLQVVGVSLDLVLSFIDVVSRKNPNSPTSESLPAGFVMTWPSVLSCMMLVLNQSRDPPSASVPGVLSGVEKLLFILASENVKEGVATCVSSVLKVKNINKFLLNLFHRMSCDSLVLNNVSIDLWRACIRQFELMQHPNPNPTSTNDEEMVVQAIAMDAFFSMASNEHAVDILTQAILPPFPCEQWTSLNILSPWMVGKLSQLLRSESGSRAIGKVWQDRVDPSFFAIKRVMTDLNLIEKNEKKPAIAVSLANAIVDCIADIILSWSTEQVSQTWCVLLRSAAQFGEIVPQKLCEASFKIVESVGYLFDSLAWKELIDSALSLTAFGNAPILFKLTELIIEEHHLSVEKLEVEKLIKILTIIAIHGKSLPVTASFKATSLVLKCAEDALRRLTKRDKHLDEIFLDFFKLASLDARAEVRNCAIKTIGSLPIPLSVLLIAESVIETAFSPGKPATPEENIPTGLIVHHSRDSEEKRWSESVVLALQACFSSMKLAASKQEAQVNIFASERLANVFEMAFKMTSMAACTEEVVVATVKFFVDVWRLSNWTQDPIFLNILNNETDSNLNNPTQITRSSSLLLPALVSVKEAPDSSLRSIFHLFSSAVTHPSIHLAHAIPFPNRASTSPWTSSEYAREIEAYKCVVTLSCTPISSVSSLKPNLYAPTEEAVRLNPFLNLLFSSLDCPALLSDFVALFLHADFVFRNSFTLAMAILTLGLLNNANKASLTTCDMQAVWLIAKTRTGPVAIASTGLWKLATQTLLKLTTNSDINGQSPTPTTDQLTHLLPSGEADPIDFAVFDSCCKFEKDSTEFVAYVRIQLDYLAHQHDLFRMYILYSILRSSQNVPSKEDDLFSSAIRVANEPFVDEETLSALAESKSFNLCCDSFLPQLIVALSGIFQRCESFETAVVAVLRTRLSSALVKGSWDAIASHLITTESLKIRSLVRELLLSLGHPEI